MHLKLLVFALFISALCEAQIEQPPPAKGNYFSKSREYVYVDSARTVYAEAMFQQMMRSGRFKTKKLFGDTILVYMVTEKEMMREPPRASPYYTTGATFAPFSATDIEGRLADLAAFRGKVVVLNYCMPAFDNCKNTAPFLNELVTEFKDKEVMFLAIAPERKEKLLRELKTTRFDYRIIPGGAALARRDGINANQVHVVINKQGKVVFHVSGYPNGLHHWLANAIQEELGK